MRHILIVSLIALSAALTPALAASSLEGSWRGSGIVTHRSTADAVRCRVSFARVSCQSPSRCRRNAPPRPAAMTWPDAWSRSGANRYFGLVQGQGVNGRL